MKVILSLMQSVGGLVACEPAARLVRRLHPGAEVYWVTSKACAPLLRFNPHVDAVVELASLCEWGRLQSTVEGQVYDLNFEGQVCAHCGEPLHKPSGGHGVRHDNWRDHGPVLPASLKGAGLPEVADQPLFWRQRSGLSVPSGWLGRRTVLLHTQASDAQRQWTLPGWAGLAGWLSQQGFTVVELGGEPGGVPSGVPHTRFMAASDWQQAALAIDMADIFIGVDSAMAQIANALQKPSVLLLGQAGRWERYFPYTGHFQDRSLVVRPRPDAPDKSVAALPLDSVLGAVQRLKAFGQVPHV